MILGAMEPRPIHPLALWAVLVCLLSLTEAGGQVQEGGVAPKPSAGPPPLPTLSRPRPATARGEREPPEGLRLLWHDASTREPLTRFLSKLVPGRSYSPGTLLSESERLETSRRGALSAAWALALSAEGEVAGGLVLDPEPEEERAHVWRAHLDVAPAWQGVGIATRLLRFARERAREHLGALVLESDPREGNLGACGALAAAGFERAGTQRGAWRLRLGRYRWDEDVLFYRCDIGP